MPYGAVGGGFDVEAVVVGECAADSAAENGEQRGGDRQDERDDGCVAVIRVDEHPNRDVGEDERCDGQHGEGVRVGVRRAWVPASVERNQSQNPVSAGEERDGGAPDERERGSAGEVAFPEPTAR
jgi:hypothetical protein